MISQWHDKADALSVKAVQELAELAASTEEMQRSTALASMLGVRFLIISDTGATPT